jgi:predicted aldo/keto reductase-like oxidoreductase
MKKLGFGCMRLPILGTDDKVDIRLFSRMTDEFLARGFTYFDTSYVYHGGMSESALKTALVDRYPRGSFTITTKLPVFLVRERSDTRRFFMEQLERLGTDYVDYYWLHALNAAGYENAVRLGVFEEVAKLQKEGRIRHLGFSFHDSAAVLDRILTEHPEMEYVQLQLNYFDWDSEAVQSGACYETATRHHKPVIVMEPVKGGVLADVPQSVRKLFREKQPNLSDASWAIRFAASLDNVMMVLSGMSNMEQLEDNTSYMEHFVPLDAEEKKIIAEAVRIFDEQKAVDCTACGKCLSVCSEHIPIPDYFNMYNDHCRMNRNTNGMVYYAAFPQGTGKASACTGCGKCEAVCPQKLPVAKLMGDVKTAFEWSMV